tara:strand:- start:729 stop:1196 length:468 start_codon:yes stop_codon:yes gene_type:complete
MKKSTSILLATVLLSGAIFLSSSDVEKNSTSRGITKFEYLSFTLEHDPNVEKAILREYGFNDKGLGVCMLEFENHSDRNLAVKNRMIPQGGKTQLAKGLDFDEEVQYIGMTPAMLLKQLGNLGWELVQNDRIKSNSVDGTRSNFKGHYIFKRPFN